jgi:TolA-binding protein
MSTLEGRYDQIERNIDHLNGRCQNIENLQTSQSNAVSEQKSTQNDHEQCNQQSGVCLVEVKRYHNNIEDISHIEHIPHTKSRKKTIKVKSSGRVSTSSVLVKGKRIH